MWMKYKTIYFLISLIVIIPGVYSLIRYGLKLSVDFTGGSTLQLKVDSDKQNDLTAKINENYPVSNFEINTDNTITYSLPPLTQTQVKDLEDKLKPEFSSLEEVSFFTVGPAVGADMIKKTLIGIGFATGIILIFVARAFKSIQFGLSAILAMFHDTLILIGSFSLLGHFFGAQADLLFVTAVLTILSFSVHDTIVVYDRIRELKRKNRHLSLSQVADKAITETLVRSLNNSLTIIFMLLALVLLGGETTRWFAMALLIGTVVGTYSSTFTATPLLIVLDNLLSQRKK